MMQNGGAINERYARGERRVGICLVAGALHRVCSSVVRAFEVVVCIDVRRAGVADDLPCDITLEITYPV